MRGQNTIIRMRLERYKPSLVWLLVLDGAAPRQPLLDAERVLEFGGRPEVHIEASDAPGTLDLRFLTGLTVLLQGTNVDRLREIFSRLREFEPEKIITSTPDLIHIFEAKP